MMFHSELVARTIHADRVRDLERAARERRLLNGSSDDVSAPPAAAFVRPVEPARRGPCGDSANVPA